MRRLDLVWSGDIYYKGRSPGSIPPSGFAGGNTAVPRCLALKGKFPQMERHLFFFFSFLADCKINMCLLFKSVFNTKKKEKVFFKKSSSRKKLVCLRMYMCVCVSVLYPCTHVCLCVLTYTHVSIHMGACICIHVHVCACGGQRTASAVNPQVVSTLFSETGSPIGLKLPLWLG